MADTLLTVLLDQLLVPRIGHGPAKWPRRVYERVNSMAKSEGIDALELVGRALSGRDAVLSEQLVDAATVGHTCFFRHPEQFEELGHVLPRLHAAKGQPIKVWCAACSTGEEAYSIAMTAEDCAVPVEILATDVNPVAIRAARAGLYTSPRSAAEHGPDSSRPWLAPETLKQRIRFEVGSLADSNPALGGGPFDLIFCRNVLIYFERDDLPAVLQGLANCLAERAALVVSPADAVLPIPDFLAHSHLSGWLKLAGALSLRPRPARNSLHYACPVSERALTRRQSMRPGPRELPPVDRAAQLLSAGKAHEAELLLTQLINVEANSTAGWYLLGEALTQRGELTQARAAFRRASSTTPSSTEDIQAEALRLSAARRSQS